MAGTEVDFVVDTGSQLVPVEVKLVATPRPAMGAAIRALRRDLPDRSTSGYVVHPGDSRLPLSAGVSAIALRRPVILRLR